MMPQLLNVTNPFQGSKHSVVRDHQTKKETPNLEAPAKREGNRRSDGSVRKGKTCPFSIPLLVQTRK